MKKNNYHSPQVSSSELTADGLIRESYFSGIDDYEYVDVDWNNNS